MGLSRAKCVRQHVAAVFTLVVLTKVRVVAPQRLLVSVTDIAIMCRLDRLAFNRGQLPLLPVNHLCTSSKGQPLRSCIVLPNFRMPGGRFSYQMLPEGDHFRFGSWKKAVHSGFSFEMKNCKAIPRIICCFV